MIFINSSILASEMYTEMYICSSIKWVMLIASIIVGMEWWIRIHGPILGWRMCIWDRWEQTQQIRSVWLRGPVSCCHKCLQYQLHCPNSDMEGSWQILQLLHSHLHWCWWQWRWRWRCMWSICSGMYVRPTYFCFTHIISFNFATNIMLCNKPRIFMGGKLLVLQLSYHFLEN